MQPHVASVPHQSREFLSESAYDALRDGLPLVVRLLQGPLSREELLGEGGFSDADLDRLLHRLERSGIVELADDRYRATAGRVQSRRQEGMITALSQFFLPALTRFADDPDHGLLLHLELALGEEEQRGLRQGEVEGLLQELYELSERPAAETQALRLIVFGAPGVAGPAEAEADPFERAMQLLRRTARDRATEERKERTVFTFADGRFGEPDLAFEALRRFASRLQPKGQADRRPGYELVVGLGPQPTVGEGR